MGPSGSGKSTLLGMLAGFDPPDTGSVSFMGRDLGAMDLSETRRMRRQELGVVFQGFGLLPTLSAVENVELPLRLAGVALRLARSQAEDLLVRLGLADRLRNRTFELSAGQQQRVAVARALAPGPIVVLADEPIAEVDSQNANLILDALAEVTARGGAVLAATHNPAALAHATSIVLLRDGKAESADSAKEVSGAPS
jgi:putative ABC transport system ATP-binding protein